MMQQLADYTVEKFGSLDLDGAPCILPVGTLEVARTPERLAELQRRCAFATSWGWRGRMADAAECARLWPIIDPSGLEGGYVTESEGLAVALRAVEAQARRAIRRGATFIGDREVVGFELAGRRIAGVRTAGGTVPADVVVCCAGVWGPAVAAHLGLTLPMLALEHQYVVTSPLLELAANAGNEATLPIVRHHDAGLYVRDHGDRVGIGSFNHRRRTGGFQRARLAPSAAGRLWCTGSRPRTSTTPGPSPPSSCPRSGARPWSGGSTGSSPSRPTDIR